MTRLRKLLKKSEKNWEPRKFHKRDEEKQRKGRKDQMQNTLGKKKKKEGKMWQQTWCAMSLS